MSKKSLIAFAIIALFSLVHLIELPQLFGIRLNTTKSLPYRVFISKPSSHIMKGQYVLFNHPFGSIPFAKIVVGVPGDQISYSNSHIFIDEQDYGEVLPKSNSGMLLTPMQEGIIPKGFVFVHAPHPESFDSRYQEFGLIREEQIEETLWPIF